MDEEKRKNPTIQIVLDKYNYDTQINRLKVLNDATGREMDYIIAFIMAYSLLTIISILLGNPKLLQPLKPYPADDIAGMMNALINASGMVITPFAPHESIALLFEIASAFICVVYYIMPSKSEANR